MSSFKTMRVIAILVSVLLLAGCAAAPKDPASAPQPTSAKPTAAQQTTEPEQTQAQAKEATWVIEIDDTQQITDEMGLIWNYKLSMYASKAGGTDVLGNYTGEIVLNMEPDFDSAKALAAREGTELLAMLFKHHSEAKDVAFEIAEYSVDAYAEQMKAAMPDSPLLPVGDPNSQASGFAIAGTTFQATQEPINMTIRDEDGTNSGTVPGRSVTVTVPMEITIEDATVYCFFYGTVHPLERSFKGVITGDVAS